jgi:hypothetical protein
VTADRVGGGALALFGLFALWESRTLPLGSLHNPGPGYMPVVLALLLVVSGALVAASGGSGPRLRAIGWSEAPRALTIVLAGSATTLILEPLGYRVAMTLLLLFLIGVVERRRPLLALTVSVGLAVLTFYVFDTLLRVPLPRGPGGL